ncbi:hypothetical protein [Streptomyces sp. C10-9-1]|uniref:hypothetical protein n=1 Tax=Streptomyces sp. C10-9-1 TaxID=1859285 RepID=UPI003F4A81BE
MRTRTAAVTAALLLATLTACGTEDAPMDQAAAVMCEQFVKERLKSPGTAEFPSGWDSDYAQTTVLSDTKPWKYEVTGVVDSQNAFGATVRSTYTCTVSTKDNSAWTLDDMQLTSR